MRRALASLALVGLIAVVLGACGQAAPTGAGRPVRILSGTPVELDPARQGDAGSAAITAQFYETLVTFDSGLTLRPALADAWRIEDGATRIVFHLRPGLMFSDGTPLRASDVVRSWLRVIDPDDPSPLASLALVIDGASAYMAGTADASAVGLTADDGAGLVTVDLARPSSDFVDVVASPTFSIVPPTATTSAAFDPGTDFVGSGGYRPTAVDDSTITLTANPRYWAGAPAIERIELVTDIGGQSPVDLFEAGELDLTSIFEQDAGWIAYDSRLGPQLRESASLLTTYYGFDTTKAPFDDPDVRRAFAQAVDWRRIGQLGSTGGDPDADVATSMVPPGIPGRSDEDFVPVHDPDAARALLATAGYPDGKGFPATSLVTGGGSYDQAVLDEIQRELGITLGYETMEFGDYIDRLDTDPPAMWSSNWVADYPGRNDFLGVLFGRDSTNDYGGWRSAAFDEAIDAAAAASDPATASEAYDRAERVLRDEAPAIPVGYGGKGWTLARDGLLGAEQNGLGMTRMAGLAWAE